jgi:hypothetical protein
MNQSRCDDADTSQSAIGELSPVLSFGGFVKSPHAALRRILRHSSVPQVRFIPQDLRALPANFLRSRPEIDFLRGRQLWFIK